MIGVFKSVLSCKRATVGMVLAVSLVSQSVFAQMTGNSQGSTLNGGTSQRSSAPTTTTTTTRNADQSGTLNGGTTQRSSVPTAPQQNVQQQGNNAAAQQAVGAASNVAMTGFLTAQCVEPTPPKPMFCAMAAATAAQAILNLALMGKSKKSADAATSGLPDYGGPDISGPGGRSGGSDDTVYGLEDPNTARLNVKAINELSSGAVTPAQLAAFDKARGALAAAGVRISKDGKTVTTRDGKTVPTAAFGSAAGMQALGMNAEQIAIVEVAKAKGANAAKQSLMAMTLDDSGGGGGRGGAGKAGSGGGGGGGFSFNMPGNKKDLSARSAAGMTRQLDRDRIGVAGDNIFQMVSRQYQKRDNENEFMK